MKIGRVASAKTTSEMYHEFSAVFTGIRYFKGNLFLTG